MIDAPRTDDIEFADRILKTITDLTEQVATVTRERDEWKACAEGLAVITAELLGDGMTLDTEHPALSRFRELKGEKE